MLVCESHLGDSNPTDLPFAGSLLGVQMMDLFPVGRLCKSSVSQGKADSSEKKFGGSADTKEAGILTISVIKHECCPGPIPRYSSSGDTAGRALPVNNSLSVRQNTARHGHHRRQRKARRPAAHAHCQSRHDTMVQEAKPEVPLPHLDPHGPGRGVDLWV